MNPKISNGVKKTSILFVCLMVVVVGIWLSLRNSKTSQQAEKQTETLRIATSFYPLQFIVSEIAQGKAEVYNLVPPGAEPHDYELTSGDMVQVEKSDLVFILGSGFEPWEDTLRDTIQKDMARVVAVGEGLIDREMVEDDTPVRDPHIWLSPKLAKKMTQTIMNILEQHDPAHRAEYKKNATDLERRFDGLHSSFVELLSSCTKKEFVTSHEAFGYLARDYGLTQIAIAGLSPDEEPSPRELANIADYVKKNTINVIFFETLVSPKLAETIAKETGAQTRVLNPLEGLSKEEIEEGKNYFTEMRQNLNNMREALQCT
ncbi:zinc ABC transporter substrate-binding protein [Candidatus Uhrbacteria bacterium]|nr:zinc ABC transporter substrate-binding protein [Candidatus Uhrbacteria bacterium]